jgi:hypothetical protein
MVQRLLTDATQMIFALNAAAYMRWVEVREGRSSTTESMTQFIKGQLEAEQFSFAPDEPQIIELLAIALNVDVVERYIEQYGIFDDLDKASSIHRSGQLPRSDQKK